MFLIKKEIINRVLEESKYIIKTKKTIRETALEFCVSKSTVHKDIHERLIDIDYNLYKELLPIMKEHIDERHLRGGESTRKKYSTGNFGSLKQKNFIKKI